MQDSQPDQSYSVEDLELLSNQDILDISDSFGEIIPPATKALLAHPGASGTVAKLATAARSDAINAIIQWQSQPFSLNDAVASAKDTAKIIAPGGQIIPVQQWMPIAPMPTDMCRVSPFFPMSTTEKKNRKYLKEMVITKSSWGEITYTGPKLSIEEEDLLMASLAALDQEKYRNYSEFLEEGSQKGKTTYTFKGSASTILKIMGKKQGGTQYKQLIEGYQLLMGGVVKLKTSRRGTGHQLTDITNLVSHVKFKQDENYLEFTINPYFYECYIGGNVTLIDVLERSMLRSPNAKALQRFILSHKDPSWTGHYLTLARTMNLDLSQDDKQLRRLIKDSIARLKERGILSSTSGFLTSTKDVVHLERISRRGIDRKKTTQQR